MYTKYFLTGASIIAAVSAGPLPQDVAQTLAAQAGRPTHFPVGANPQVPAPGGPEPVGPEPIVPLGPGPVIPTPASVPAPSGVLPPVGVKATGTAPVSTGTGAPSSGGNSTSPVSVKGKVSGPLAVSKINDNDGKGSGKDDYKMFSGDGSTGAGWPGQDDWASFDGLFSANKALMKSSCAQFQAPDDTDAEISDIHSAIESVALATQLDHRFILAIIMQESKGCVRVHSTNNGVHNPGLMQDHNGKSNCNDGSDVKTPCPKSEIQGMVAEGAGGTPDGPGLAQLMGTVGGSDASTFYKAARAYNSGSVDASGDLGKGIATHCYASDVANRLMGWVQAPTKCTLDGGAK